MSSIVHYINWPDSTGSWWYADIIIVICDNNFKSVNYQDELVEYKPGVVSRCCYGCCLNGFWSRQLFLQKIFASRIPTRVISLIYIRLILLEIYPPCRIEENKLFCSKFNPFCSAVMLYCCCSFLVSKQKRHEASRCSHAYFGNFQSINQSIN